MKIIKNIRKHEGEKKKMRKERTQQTHRHNYYHQLTASS